MADKVISKIDAMGVSKDIHDARISDFDQVPTSSSLNCVTAKGIVEAGNAIADKILKGISAGVKDLSALDINGNPTGGVNTANTYVITEPGTYKIPVVYGNGIKNGQPNPTAYTLKVPDDSPETSWYGNFVNYLGNTITNPYIEKDTEHAVASAELLWQTYTNMVTSVSVALGVECSEIVVEIELVPKNNGIAVVAAKDENGDIMWSWTLWMVADKSDFSEDFIIGKGYDLTETIDNDGYHNVSVIESNPSITYTVLKRPLCTVWNGNDRSHIKTAVYNFGRKDPFPPQSFDDADNYIPVYDINGNAVDISAFGSAHDYDQQKTVANAIKTPASPFIAYESNGTWESSRSIGNFWNNQGHFYSTSTMIGNNLGQYNSTAYDGYGTNEKTAVKTIYDPCPYGYMVPTSLVFTGFQNTFTNIKQTITNNESETVRLLTGWNNGIRLGKFTTDTEGYLIPDNGQYEYDSGKPSAEYDYGQYFYSDIAQNAATPQLFLAHSFTIQKTNDTTFHVAFHEMVSAAGLGGVIPMKDWSTE